MSYKNLEIWQLAREVAVEIHKMSLEQLPKFEQFETGHKSDALRKVPALQLLKVMEEEHIRLNISNF